MRINQPRFSIATAAAPPTDQNARARNLKLAVFHALHLIPAQLDPRHAEAIASLAAIAARKGDEKVARNQAARALKLDPSNATALAALALIESRRAAEAAFVPEPVRIENTV